jgi:hypothetical protein
MHIILYLDFAEKTRGTHSAPIKARYAKKAAGFSRYAF